MIKVVIISTNDSPIEMCTGDIKNDDAINMSDVIKISKAFNTKKGDENYNLKCDLNEDGVVNMIDIMIIAKNFNATSQTLSIRPLFRKEYKVIIDLYANVYPFFNILK